MFFGCHNEVDWGMAGSDTHCRNNRDGSPAHTVYQVVESGPFGSKRVHYIIVLCDKWFDLPTTSRVIENVENSRAYPRNNAKTMISQGKFSIE